MLAVGNSLVSEELLDRQFTCDLKKCKGECCVAGDAGAPLDDSELAILDAVFPKVKKYMTPEGIASIEKYGTHVIDSDGEHTTTLMKGKGACAFVRYDDEIAFCSIEKAWMEGDIDWQKPVSCHLYPVRITAYDGFDAVNYHHWPICSPACALGKELQMPTYLFVKDALVRKYGQEWFDELDALAKYHERSKSI